MPISLLFTLLNFVRSMGDAPAVDEDCCAGCRLSPLDISLVLTCNHRLCLGCAQRELRWPRSGDPTAGCPICGSLTEVDPLAAEQIQETGAPLPPPRPPAKPPTLPKSPRSLAEDKAKPLPAPTSWSLTSPLPSPRPAVSQHRQVAATLCGQCQAVSAVLECRQCDELFCQACASSMHRMGQMREHRLIPAGGVPDRGRSGSSTPSQEPEGRSQSPLPAPKPTVHGTPQWPVQSGEICDSFCPFHPEESVRFFCLDCQTECTCAECAVQRDGRHYGHDVVNVRSAYHRLSSSIDSLLVASSARAQERAEALKRSAALRLELDLILSRGKQGIQEAFNRLHASIQHKESALLKGAEDCGQAADAILLDRAEQVERRAEEVPNLRSMLDGLQLRVPDLPQHIREACQLKVAEVAQLVVKVGEIRSNEHQETEQEIF
ncbi:unnamed protein product [Polarella glacialis]|uniref:Uncharacterized protein n=1 Tax=Polarella glacialis TaxID=89957 RepID=A0A813EX55_POLGL|nr:unnamed protein product [Polarella glacialis]